MVYNKKYFSVFDKALFATAAAVLVFALFFLPKESFRLIRDDLYVTQNWTEYLKNGEISKLSQEFEAANPHLALVFKDEGGDVVARAMPVLGAPELENRIEVASFINPLFYNITLLKAHGFDRPPKTRGDFLAAALKINSDDTKAIAFSGNIFEDILPWFWSAGIQTDWSSRAAVDTLEFLKKLAEEGIITWQPELDKRSLFMEGKCAFYIGSTLDFAALEEGVNTSGKEPKFEWSVTAIPVPDKHSGKPAFNVTSWEIGISPESENKETALLYVQFISGRRAIFAGAAGLIPDTEEDEDGAASTLKPVILKARTLFEGADIIHDTAVFDDIDYAEDVFKNALLRLFNGEQTAKETAAELNKAFSKK